MHRAIMRKLSIAAKSSFEPYKVIDELHGLDHGFPVLKPHRLICSLPCSRSIGSLSGWLLFCDGFLQMMVRPLCVEKNLPEGRLKHFSRIILRRKQKRS